MLKFVVLFATVALCAAQVNSNRTLLENQAKLLFLAKLFSQDAAVAPVAIAPAAADVLPPGPPPGPPRDGDMGGGPPGPFGGGPPPTPDPKQCKVNYLKVIF